MQQPADHLKQTIYVELVRGLFTTLTPSAVMSLVFLLCVALVASQGGSTLATGVGIAGIVASVARLATIAAFRGETFSPALTAPRARTLEHRFMAAYLSFALCLGAYGGVLFAGPGADIHMLTACLLVGYCAGVAAGIGLRPGIAIPSMIIAMAPAIIVAALSGAPLYIGMAAITGALLAAGCRSVLERHRLTIAEIGKRITFESLARRDELTELPNRLALREAFEGDFAGPAKGELIAVHYLDLDGFKPVNDRFGHPVGDALLVAVSERIREALLPGDIAARLGGDEFVILQRGLRHADETEMTVQRLLQALHRPFPLGGRDIRISACIGTVTTADTSRDLEYLLERADTALYAAKRRGAGRAERAAA
ncbi:diguanylate cyclase domain-containing protein [Sphingoaurantiacus capsulatus]|uniref:Diguanylate cyclase domain-containing protein n=1 Tax=Sphingoaurantiacus capsulatus TaxID=1771310 RepID=A0ABV7X4W1_9SPHN